MARVKLSPLLTDISGSIGGVTIQRNKFGITLRQKPLPLNPATAAQYNIRQKIVLIQKAWQDLTDAQRLQWDRFSDFSGQTIRKDRSVRLSGHSLYLKYQLMRLLCGESLLTTIEYSPMPDVLLIDQITQATTNFLLYFSGLVDSTKYFFLFRITSPRPKSTRFSPRGLRYMYVAKSSDTYYHLEDPYIAAFGAIPVIGNVISYTIQYFSITAPVFSGIYTEKAEIIAP